MKIALFSTCIVDAMFPQAAQATVHLLRRLGYEIDFPQTQACCGQMHINTGYYDEAMPILRNYVDTFEPVLDGEWEAVVAPSASCIGSIHTQGAMVARDRGDEVLAERIEAIGAKTYELCTFLTDVYGSDDLGAYFPHTVTYHPTCHSLRVEKLGDRPYRLMSHVKGLDLTELPENSCCGFGGTFSLKNPEVSYSMLTDKMSNILATKAEIVLSADYSCLMNIGGGLSRLRSGVRAMHIAEVLAPTEDDPWTAPQTDVKVGA
ncbi:MAG: (Fe-S)-binding protein [Actinomycetaceae bacterium]|nr:(Fe-S)-binding protein [Actinomycetaceae bacterium]MDY6082607.1 (Fe-S)-binding protein [Actinomycetaceae bacterium]